MLVDVVFMPVASLGLVSPGVATDGVTYFFPEKNWRPFLLITVTFLDFTRVSPPGGCHQGRSAPLQWRHWFMQ